MENNDEDGFTHTLSPRAMTHCTVSMHAQHADDSTLYTSATTVTEMTATLKELVDNE